MKILKPRYDLIALFFPTLLLVALIAYNFYFPLLMQISNINWLLDLIVLFLLFLPSTRQALGKQEQRVISKWAWISSIFSIQLLCNTLFWGLSQFIYFHASPSTPHPIDAIWYSLTAGMFPFGYMMLVTATLGYFTYIKKNSGTVASTYSDLLGNSDTDSAGIIVNTYMRLLNYYVIVFCLGVAAILFLYLFHFLTGIDFPYGLKLNVILICCALIGASSNQYVLKKLHQLAYWKIPLWIILVSFSLVLSISYLILSKITYFLTYLNPNLDTQIFIFDTHLKDHLEVIITFVWLGFATIAGAIIAALSRSYSLRNIILVSFVTNIISWLLVYFLAALTKSVGEILVIILVLVSVLVVLMYLLQKRNITYVMRATLPGSNLKQRSTFSLIQVLPLVIAAFITSYLTTGIHFLSLSAVIIILPCLVMILISFVALLKSLFA